MKQRRYVVDLAKLWPDIFASIPGENEIDDLVGFIQDYPDLEFPDLVERALTQDEIQFCTDYSTYKMCNPSTSDDITEEELFVYQGFLVRKTGRAAAKDTAPSQLRRRTTTKPQDILIEVSTVDAIPPFSKWIKDTELYKVL